MNVYKYLIVAQLTHHGRLVNNILIMVIVFSIKHAYNGVFVIVGKSLYGL